MVQTFFHNDKLNLEEKNKREMKRSKHLEATQFKIAYSAHALYQMKILKEKKKLLIFPICMKHIFLLLFRFFFFFQKGTGQVCVEVAEVT